MDDLINRRAAIDVIGEVHPLDYNAQAIKSRIESLPSAQPEIIRCKECKYSEHWYKDKRRCFLWHEAGIDVFEDGYCNYAERRPQ